MAVVIRIPGSQQDERYADAYDAALTIIQCGRKISTDVDPWRVPDQYTGPMYDTVVTEAYQYGGCVIRVQWRFVDRETEGRDMEDWPWDNGTMEIVEDGYIVTRED